QFTLIVAPRVVITATTLPGAKVGRPYQAAIAATGGGSLRWSVIDGSLPPGLALDPATGSLTGTPSAAGSFPFTVQVGDEKRKTTQHYDFNVAAPLGVNGAALALAEVGRPISLTVASTGGLGPLRWSAASVPGGRSLAPCKGLIRGPPTAAGAFTVTVTAQDSDGETANAVVKLSVAPRLAVAPPRVASTKTGASYRVRLSAVGGVAPRTWTVV